MSYDNFKKMVLDESPVGKSGRTSHIDAEDYINENPSIVEDFRKIVIKMGGKMVASRVLDRIVIKSKPANKDLATDDVSVVDDGSASPMTESIDAIEKHLRDSGFKIKSSTPNKNGSKELEFYKIKDVQVAIEELESIGANEKYNLASDGYKTLTVSPL